MRRIGIIGGGQLGRMTIEAARGYEVHIEVLSPELPSPASSVADRAIRGDIRSRDAVLDFAQGLDIISYEIESVSIEALFEIERRGGLVLPAAAILADIADKSVQKALLDRAGLPTAPWLMVEQRSGLPPAPSALAKAAEGLGGFPLIQKACLGGYDGRGVALIESADAPGLLPGPSFVERRVDFVKELAVIVARAADGSSAVYPCVEMVFDERANLCDSVLAPARESEMLRARAEELALEAVRALAEDARLRGAPPNGVAGVFAVEMFLAATGELLINEIAPRPHNSGHYTMEASVSSQFDQYVRILLGLPLGSPELLRPAAMLNLLGAPGESGAPEYVGLERALNLPGVSIHIYGKKELRPFRKMGHLTALGRDAEEALDRATAARDAIRIVAACSERAKK